MSGNLSSRIERLERQSGPSVRTHPKVVRIVTSDDDEQEVLRLADEKGYDTGPYSTDILLVRLMKMPERAHNGES